MSNVPTSKAITEFLTSHLNLVLATTRADGTIQMTPVWFIWEDDSFLISTVKRTVKWKNLKRDQRCSVIADDPAIHYVSASGKAELIEGDVYDATQRIVQKYKTPAEIDKYMREIYKEGDRVIIRLKPDRMHTYNIE
ncbi:MAG: PPOX class F420-dependent oxidoreductase [Chloroflexi bacterium]|nr:PPOX class F420-dependent oxidoreductase [Chloroflexota bacterium]